MKKLLVCLFAVLLTFTLLLGTAAAEDEIDVSVDLTYEYTMARDVLGFVNDFRTHDTWQYDKDNNKVDVPAQSALIYDDGLENVAMQRAAECAIRYAHERPNGQSCFSIYPSGGARGENIAAGYTSASAVFNGWKEEDEKYAGQGHRRNMLNSSFQYIGIGCVRSSNGVYFWCQAFSSVASGKAGETFIPPYKMTASLKVLTEAGLNTVAPAEASLSIAEGESAAAPILSAVSGSWGHAPIKLLNPAWKATGSIVTVSGMTVTGVAGGNTTITWTADKLTAEVPVHVICKNHTPGEEKVTVPATCTHTGTKTSLCTVCGEPMETEIPIDPNAHTWGLPAYNWAADNSSVDASRACMENPEHTEKETAQTTSSVKVPATYAAPGITTYQAVFVNTAFGTVTRDVPDIPQLVPKGVNLSSLKAGKKELTVKWKKGSDIDGYEIEYSLKKTFKGAKKVTVSKAGTTETVLKKLKSKKTYYVRIRTFKKFQGKKYYSEWSKARSKKVK